MFRNIFSFEGRIRRTEYGITFIIYVVFYILIRIFSEGLEGMKLLVILYLPLLWFIYAQGSKRCHDLGKSGWWQLIPFYSLWLLFQAGDLFENEYGTNPKNPEVFNEKTYHDPVVPNNNELYKPRDQTNEVISDR